MIGLKSSDAITTGTTINKFSTTPQFHRGSFFSSSVVSSSSFGKRPVPNVQTGRNSCLKKKKEQAKVYKKILLSEFVDTKISTVLEVTVDLKKIESSAGTEFGVYDVQNEIGFQISMTNVLIITYKNGVPIKDSPNTRGK